MANEAEKLPVFESLGFNPEMLKAEDIAFIRLCRKVRFGTLETVAVHEGVPTVAKTVVQRFDFTRESGPIIEGEVEVISPQPTDQA